MSASLADVTLTLNTPVQVPIQDYPQEWIHWVVLINASPFACHASFGGYVFTLPAWYYYPVQVRDDKGNPIPGVSTPFTITPYLQTIPGVGFTSTLHSSIYGQGEMPPSTIAAPLGGGPINLAIASSIQNTGSPTGTNIVFALPFGDPNTIGGATNINNSGFATFGDNQNSGQVQVGGVLGVLTLLPNTIKESSGSLNFDTDIASDVMIFKNAGTEVMRIIAAAMNVAGIIAPNNAATVVNGSVTGTISFYTPFWGTAGKMLIVTMNNYNSANVASFNLPSAMAFTLGYSGNFSTSQTFSLFSGGTAQNMQQLTALGAVGVAGTFSISETSMHSGCLFASIASWSQFQMGTIGTGQTGEIVIVGT